MRKAIAILAGLAALGVALARALRPPPVDAPEVAPGPDPRADELREKLAEAREAATDRDEAEAGETTVDAVEATGDDLTEKRKQVHAEGEAVAAEMRRRSSPKPKPEE
jgi:hypothetical protein